MFVVILPTLPLWWKRRHTPRALPLRQTRRHLHISIISNKMNDWDTVHLAKPISMDAYPILKFLTINYHTIKSSNGSLKGKLWGFPYFWRSASQIFPYLMLSLILFCWHLSSAVISMVELCIHYWIKEKDPHGTYWGHSCIIAGTLPPAFLHHHSFSLFIFKLMPLSF